MSDARVRPSVFFGIAGDVPRVNVRQSEIDSAGFNEERRDQNVTSEADARNRSRALQ